MKVRYKKNLVAFIDLLGFSKVVFNKEIILIQDYFNSAINNLKSTKFFKESNSKFTLISDSIIIWCPATYEDFKILIQQVAIIQGRLIKIKVLTRGAISSGNFYANKSNNIIVGPALINAYHLEPLAIYPRVIIDRKLIKEFEKSTNEIQKDLNGWLTTRGNTNYNEDYLYIDYIRYTTTRIMIYGGKAKENFESLFKENLYVSNKNYEKYKWLQEQFLIELKKTIETMSNKQTTSSGNKIRRKKAPMLYEFLKTV